MNKKDFKNIISTVTGIIFIAVATKYFVFPLSLYQAGVSGIAILVTKLGATSINDPMNLTTFNLVYILLNLPLVIWAWFKISRRFVALSLITVLGIPVVLSILPNITLLNIEQHKAIATIFGAGIFGLGAAFVYRAGGCTGGTDFISVYIVKHKPKIPIGKINLFLSLLVIGLSQIILSRKFNLSLFNNIFFYTIAFYGVLQSTMDKYFPRHKIIKTTVITNGPQEVINLITTHFPHKAYSKYEVSGVTKIKKQRIDILMSYYEAKEFMYLLEKSKINHFAYTSKLANVFGQFSTKK